jgi:hypothetical protein
MYHKLLALTERHKDALPHLLDLLAAFPRTEPPPSLAQTIASLQPVHEWMASALEQVLDRVEAAPAMSSVLAFLRVRQVQNLVSKDMTALTTEQLVLSLYWCIPDLFLRPLIAKHPAFL